MNPSERLKYLFDKYLERQCSPEELEELILALQRDKRPGLLDNRMEALWAVTKEEQKTYPVDWDAVYQSVIHAEDDLPAIGKRRHGRWIQIAAALFLLMTGIVLFRYFHQRTEQPTGPIPAQAVSRVRDNSLPGKRQTIHLPDGSTVILNADSRVDYPSAFTGKTREIYLTGEAFFDIRHDPGKPFLVHTGRITTKVLGTAFDIKAYPGDESIRVTVTRGKVQVWKENKSLGLIAANHQISFSKKTEAVAEAVVDTRTVVAWKPQEISFNDISMEEAAKKIEERFGMTVEFANPAVKNCLVTATFSEDDLPEEILLVICGVSKSTFTIQNQKIIIDGKGCKD
jgi:ferric-dicitrate binding protein FerR (iron transport regulator)